MKNFTRRERFLAYVTMLSSMLVFNVMLRKEPLLPILAGCSFVLVVVAVALWIEANGWITLRKRK